MIAEAEHVRPIVQHLVLQDGRVVFSDGLNLIVQAGFAENHAGLLIEEEALEIGEPISALYEEQDSVWVATRSGALLKLTTN